jgi:hypothetical protein
MFPFRTLPVPRCRPLALLVAWCLLGTAGCSKPEVLYPVSGKVYNGGAPLTSGMVRYVPEGGDKLAGQSSGTIGSDGTYTLYTNGKPGAPPGKYKVAISTMVPPGPEVTMDEKPHAGPPINRKYNSPDSSGLTREVVADPSPDQYDLKLLK